MYTYNTTVRLHHTDAAGILFFAHLFVIVHECYESFLEPEVTFNSIFNEQGLKMPIVHAEADYHKPLRTSDKITIKPQLKKMGDSSLVCFRIEIHDRSAHGRHELGNVLQHDGVDPLVELIGSPY